MAALSLSSSPARVSPERILSVKSKLLLENPFSTSVANEPGRNRGSGTYSVERENSEVIWVRLGRRDSQYRRVKNSTVISGVPSKCGYRVRGAERERISTTKHVSPSFLQQEDMPEPTISGRRTTDYL